MGTIVFCIKEKSKKSLKTIWSRRLSWMHSSWNNNFRLIYLIGPILIEWKKSIYFFFPLILTVNLVTDGNQLNFSFLSSVAKHLLMKIYLIMVLILFLQLLHKIVASLIRVRVCKCKLIPLSFCPKLKSKTDLNFIEFIHLNFDRKNT